MRAVKQRGIQLHLRRREVRKDAVAPHLLARARERQRKHQGRARRWVVERTNSWHNNFRGLRVRWELKAERYLALVHFACALITYRAATRKNGHKF